MTEGGDDKSQDNKHNDIMRLMNTYSKAPVEIVEIDK